ncbi:flavodoxin [Gordonibacter urolithinfaciens]|uniref:flavodoxin n=1 Tax=Gordonibacter urolithinfaciens TaxID=1335613 RepID=UPI003A948C56
MDRRTFVMGSFGFGMAVLGGGMLAGCAAGDEPAAPEAPEPVAVPETPEPAAAPEPKAGGGRALVAVFSYSGTTLTVAERIAEATGADLFRIETTDAWPDDYDAMTAQVQREQDEGYLPQLAAAVQDWDAYDTVYLGHPIWWGQLPHVVRSFLAQHDLAGKTAAPFSTSSSSGNAAALDALRELCPEADVREALHLTRGSLPGALDEVEPWIEGLARA